MKKNFPFDGELFPSSKKKYEEVIFFVHFFEGNKRLLKRHIKTVNVLGFDAFAFTLPMNWNLLRTPISRDSQLGLKHYYADVIEDLLNILPGRKIIFSFSNPSASAIEAMARRNCTDIQALICDSGPSASFYRSTINLSKQFFKEGHFLKAMAMPLSPIFWSPWIHRDIGDHLNSFPPNFPILSIRGWKDPLIPPHDIDDVFNGHPQVRWQKLGLPMAGHLNGLRDFRKEYLAGLIPFLEQVSTSVPQK